jgi:hypothetical protein
MNHVRLSLLLLALGAGLLAGGCVLAGRPPHAVLPPIAEEYHACARCGSLHGGIYGKGPLLPLTTPAGERCVHRWERIERADFQRHAAARFPEAWAAALPFFHRAD